MDNAPPTVFLLMGNAPPTPHPPRERLREILEMNRFDWI